MTGPRALVLDAAAVDALATHGSARARTSRIDSLLAREPGLRTRDTDRALARLVGGVLNAADAGSELLAGAHCVATAPESGGGLVLTGDPDDLHRLADVFPNVIIEPIA